MYFKRIKQFTLLLSLFLSSIIFGAPQTNLLNDGYSHIIVHESNVQGAPRTSSIIAYVDGHNLTVIITENLGQLTVEVSNEIGEEVQSQSTSTPNSVILNISNPGNYTVYFILANGDEYYGEFEITN